MPLYSSCFLYNPLQYDMHEECQIESYHDSGILDEMTWAWWKAVNQKKMKKKDE